jgi:hydrogenase maturation protease
MNEWEWRLLEDTPDLASVETPVGRLHRGGRVRLRPGAGADVMDLALEGRTATIASIEQDYEGEIQLSVVLDGDPGGDLGSLRQPGHRFFFRLHEVEPVDSAAPPRSVLVAGIGNIFLGDDGFGVEVAQRLAGQRLPDGVRVADFGIRSYDLAYALTSGCDTAILVDAAPRGGPPGSLYLIDADIGHSEAVPEAAAADGHTMNPAAVLRLARSLGEPPRRVLVVGCEPATFGGDEGVLGLSEAVRSAVPEAVELVRGLVDKIARGESPFNGRRLTKWNS